MFVFKTAHSYHALRFFQPQHTRSCVLFFKSTLRFFRNDGRTFPSPLQNIERTFALAATRNIERTFRIHNIRTFKIFFSKTTLKTRHLFDFANHFVQIVTNYYRFNQTQHCKNNIRTYRITQDFFKNFVRTFRNSVRTLFGTACAPLGTSAVPLQEHLSYLSKH